MFHTAPERLCDVQPTTPEPHGRLPLITPASVEFYSALMLGLGEPDRARIQSLLVVAADDPDDRGRARP